MTVALKISVLDGVVMGSDSRTSILREDGTTQVFDGVRKLFVLHRDYPAALMSWGVNRIDGQSLEQIMIQIRERLKSSGKDDPEWNVDLATISLSELAEKITHHLFHDHFQPAMASANSKLSLHLHFAGYSPGKRHPEHVEYRLEAEHMHGPHSAETKGVQVNYTGNYVSRLLAGADPRLLGALTAKGVAVEDMKKAVSEFSSRTLRNLFPPQMPLPAVAAAVRCLINSEIVLQQQGPEPDSVGGDVQLLVIDRQGCREFRHPFIDFRISESAWQRRTR